MLKMLKNRMGMTNYRGRDAEHLELTTGLKKYVEKQIYDTEVKKTLEQAAENPTYYFDVLQYLSRRIGIAAKNHQPQPGESVATLMYLVSDAGNVALKLLQEVFKEANDGSRRKREPYGGPKLIRQQPLAKQVVLVLRLMILALFYAIRATINENAPATEVIDTAYKQPQDAVKKFRTILRDYDAQVRDCELYQKLPVGWKEAGDALAYSAWSRDFGKDSDVEINWSLFAHAVSSELVYQSRKMQERRWWKEALLSQPGIATPLLFLKALALWIFKVTTGFGLKPARFGLTVFATMFIFSFLYFIDDTVARCKDATGSMASYWQEIYYAIGNFTSIGTNPGGPCGPFTDMLISIETLIGYFLLSVLAAMLIGWLIDH
jgi:hypothetical protein